jgi:moderate conductance mechanosensitive channel
VQKPPRHRKLGGLMKNMLVRLGFLPVIVWLLLTLMPATSLAQQPPAEVPPEKAKQFLELLSDPEVKAWLEGSNCSPPALVRQD